MREKVVGALAALFVLAGGAAGTYLAVKYRRTPPREGAPSAVRTVKVRALARADVPIEITGYGTVRARDSVPIAPEVRGRVVACAPGLEVGRKGNIEADESNGRTSRVGVWAAGDVVTGAATVISAMGAARAAAKDMHEYLMAGKPADKWDVAPEQPAPAT